MPRYIISYQLGCDEVQCWYMNLKALYLTNNSIKLIHSLSVAYYEEFWANYGFESSDSATYDIYSCVHLKVLYNLRKIEPVQNRHICLHSQEIIGTTWMHWNEWRNKKQKYRWDDWAMKTTGSRHKQKNLFIWKNAKYRQEINTNVAWHSSRFTDRKMQAYLSN